MAPIPRGAAGLRGDSLEQCLELAALAGGQRRQQFALDLAGCTGGAIEGQAALRRKLEQVAAAIAGIARAPDEASCFEPVEQGDEVAGVDVERLAKAELGDRPRLGELVEDRELAPAKADPVELASQPRAGGAGKSGDQKGGGGHPMRIAKLLMSYNDSAL
jgi:hypothetical protein